MLIQGTSISVTYKKIDGIKRAYYNNESILKEYFNEATVLPIPDDAPVEIPRIIIKTLHEHAQLNISPVATTFEVHYDAGFENDWNSCARYIEERMSKVFEFLNILTSNAYEYIGVVTNVIYDEIERDGARIIADRLLNSQNIRGIYDVNIRYTFVENENMFVNIMLQNARMFREGATVDEAGALNISNQIAESIGAVIDINDRYGFNNDPEYRSDSSELQALLRSMSNIINNKLRTLIQRGEY